MHSLIKNVFHPKNTMIYNVVKTCKHKSYHHKHVCFHTKKVKWFLRDCENV